MTKEAMELKAKIYVYDLKNCAIENGFKTDENWEFSLTNNAEKHILERKYFPTISAKVLPEFLSELIHLVKSKINHVSYNHNTEGDYNMDSELQFLVAYNPARLRH